MNTETGQDICVLFLFMNPMKFFRAHNLEVAA